MDLSEIRQQIDEIDQELVGLFCRRMGLSAQVADYKKANNLPIFVPAGSGPFCKRWRNWPARKWRTTPGCCTLCSSS